MFRPTSSGTYKPSVLGVDIYRETGKTILKEPKLTSGIGLRLPTKQQTKKKRRKNFLGI